MSMILPPEEMIKQIKEAKKRNKQMQVAESFNDVQMREIVKKDDEK